MKRKRSKESLRRMEEGKIRFTNNLGTEYILTSEYENAKTHVTVKHCKCGMEYKVRPDNFNSGKRCPYCYQKSKKGSKINRIPNDFLNNIKGQYKLKSQFKGVRKPIFLEHLVCGTIFQTLPRHFNSSDIDSVYGKCPTCYGRFTSGEYKIMQYLSSNSLLFATQHSFADCFYKKKLKFDFVVYDSGYNIFCLIEFQGEQHYNYSEFFYKNMEKYKESQLKDRIKREYCKNNNIRLLEIPYWDIDNIKTILDDYLSDIV